MYRRGVSDRHPLAQFIYLVMLEPSAYEVQRSNFIRFVQSRKAPSSDALSGLMLLEMSHHAERVTDDMTATMAAGLWELNQTGAHTGRL